MDKFVHLMAYDSNKFNVLNHGDCWSNNILFKYAEDNCTIEETFFVDFQNPTFTPPGQDLFYFLLSSTQLNIKLDKFDYFIRYYHEHLVHNLKLLKYPNKIPKLKDLQMDLMDFGLWALVVSYMTLPVVLLDKTENANFDNYVSDSEEGNKLKSQMFTNERYIEHINKILEWLRNKGLLEMK